MFVFLRPLMVAVIALMLAFPAYALEKKVDPGELFTVFGEGHARIEGTNYIQARNNAIRSALNNALGHVLEAVLSPEEIEAQTAFIETDITPRALDFVQRYRFIEDGPAANHPEEAVNAAEGEEPLPLTDKSLMMEGAMPGTWYVQIEFTFFLTNLQSALSNVGITVAGGNRPKVVVIINEQMLGMTQGPGALVLPSGAEDNVVKALSAQGYKVFERTEVRKLNNDRRIMSAMEGDQSAVKWLGEQYGASYIVVGTARSQTVSGSGTTPTQVQGIVDAMIFDAATARPIWDDVVSVMLDGGTPGATFKAVRLASEKFAHITADFLARP